MTYVIFIGFRMHTRRRLILGIFLIGMVFSVAAGMLIVESYATETFQNELEEVEINEYEGKGLSSIDDFFENSIAGPQYIDEESYRLTIGGLVDEIQEYTYSDVITNHQSYKKVVTLNCVEGWNVTLLWEGFLVKDLLDEAGILPIANTVIFYAVDGYSTSLPLDFIIDNNIMIAYKMNDVTLPPERGFPFQLVAESKWGYKWIKWVTAIEVSNNFQYRGYWESRGYSNNAEITEYFFEGGGGTGGTIPEFPSWVVLPLVFVATSVAVIFKKRLNKNLMKGS
jgi:DMSO/TMAO reductase YedYZ molybdopterin-dependent catalytic subunit